MSAENESTEYRDGDTLELTIGSNDDPRLAIWTVEQSGTLFEEVFGRRMVVKEDEKEGEEGKRE